MIVALIISLPVAAFAIWVFFKYPPRGTEKKKIHLFNAVVIVLAVLLCVAIGMGLRVMLAGGPDRAWWPVLFVLSTLVAFPASLLVGAVIRNLVVFRP